MYMQLKERGGVPTEDIVDAAAQAVGNAHGHTSVRAKMQAIIFEATYSI